MKVIIAPDSFKGSISALGAAEAIERGVLLAESGAQTVLIPCADGGEGTVAALQSRLCGQLVNVTVHDPQMRKITASYLRAGDLAVVEMAAASGLTLTPEGERNVLRASTFGTGELVLHALNAGAKRLYVGLGGSATNDGGIGFLAALGAKFMGEDQKAVSADPLGVERAVTADFTALKARISGVSILALCDVTNPLTGENGASAVFGPQKGASPETVRRLDGILEHFATVCGGENQRAGDGAAGGLCFALREICGAEVTSGIDKVLEICEFDRELQNADMVITGEGRVDSQSAEGKVASGIIKRAKGVPVAVLTGCVGKGARALYDVGAAVIMPIADRPMSLDESISRTAELLTDTAERLIRAAKVDVRGRGAGNTIDDGRGIVIK